MKVCSAPRISNCISLTRCLLRHWAAGDRGVQRYVYAGRFGQSCKRLSIMALQSGFVFMLLNIVGIVTLMGCSGSMVVSDWPQWGRDATKNMAGPDEYGIPSNFDPSRRIGRSNKIDLAKTKHIKWIAELGSNTYGNPTVAMGRVYIGTNNDLPRDPKLKGDRSNIYCLNEESGDLIWQFSAPKLGAGKVGDWEYLGICSSPTIDGERVYAVTNRCEVICLDAAGLADGNDGLFQDEGKYLAGPNQSAIETSTIDADIIWHYDMASELGVFPHNVTSSSVLVVGDTAYATSSNGVDYSHRHIINPRAPALIALEKHTGRLIGEEMSSISGRTYHGNWSSPSYGTVNGASYVFFGAGDGFCYAFYSQPVPDDDGYGILKERWRFDCNPPQYKATEDGKAIRYPAYEGPSEIIASPVFYKNKVYVAIGQDPEHGEGVGALSCIDATQQGDISRSGLIWQYTQINRTISTVSVVDDLLYIADYAGVVHCLDANSGGVYWTHDTLGHIWGSTLVSGGKVYIGNEDGVFTILAAGKKKKVISEIMFDGPIYSSPIMANGTLYVATMSHLYAIAHDGR